MMSVVISIVIKPNVNAMSSVVAKFKPKIDEKYYFAILGIETAHFRTECNLPT